VSFDWAAKTVLRDPSNFGIFSGFLSELLCKDVVYFNLSQGLDYIYSGRTNYIGMHTKEMKAKGISIDIISDITGLSREKISKL
jgi:hypothetical protein